jgi:hypothetical protein
LSVSLSSWKLLGTGAAQSTLNLLLIGVLPEAKQAVSHLTEPCKALAYAVHRPTHVVSLEIIDKFSSH